tara:strand:+ start:1649 stop:3247 length:1599 start_codon:yes stop_codon:yes gene_type:complete
MKAEKFKNIFAGLDRAHGEYRYSETKVNGKRDGQSYTKHEEPTLQMFANHLEGKNPSLGIMPTRDDATAIWGCIDIDEYPLDHKKILSKIRQYKLPLVMCASKSFGAHVFLFSKKPQPAYLFQQKLKEIASYIGYANTEIFPKQIKLASEKDAGSWLNLPYHGETRYAFLDNGEGASLDEFFDLYDKYVCDDISKIAIKVEQEVIKDGPPCLQILTTQGFPDKSRNNGLINIGIFYHKSDPDAWIQLMEQYNRDYMKPPLDAKEVTSIQKSILKEKADGTPKYNYRCTQPPIESVCNKPLCKTRKYGIGVTGNDHPVYSDFRALDSHPKIWFLNIDSDTIETDNWKMVKFHENLRDLVSEQFLRFIPRMKQNDWEPMLAVLFENITKISVPEDVSKVGEFKDYLIEFCVGRGESFTVDELDMEKPFTDYENKISFGEGDTSFTAYPTYFRLRDLSKWLENSKNFKQSRAWIVQRLKNLHAVDVKVYPNKTQARAWAIPSFPKPNRIKNTPNLKTIKPKDSDLLKEDDEEIPF